MTEVIVWIIGIILLAILAGWISDNFSWGNYKLRFINQNEELTEQTSLLKWLSSRWKLWLQGNWRWLESDFKEEVTANPVSTRVTLELDLPLDTRTNLTIDVLSSSTETAKPDVKVKAERDGLPVQVHVGWVIDGNADATGQGLTANNKLSGIVSKGPINTSRTSNNRVPFEWLLFIFSATVYLITRIIGLDRFPIYFFTDEAVHTLLAETLVENQFHFNGVFLPTYFPIGSSFALNSLSVYLQVLPYIIFGKSVFITRMVSVVISLIGAIAVSFTLKNFLRSKYWWAGILILSIIPTWFLHSRTAFEYVELTSFYALFINFYLAYRLKSPKYLYLAILAGMMVFYTHGLGQILIATTGVVFLVVDFNYHRKHPRIMLIGLFLGLLLALPFFRFTNENPSAFQDQLRARGSYWINQDLSFFDKISHFGSEYLKAYDPTYLFFQNNAQDLARHLMKDYGHILFIWLPFTLFGLWVCIRNIRDPAYRTILIMLLVSPVGAALAQVSILRIIWIVVPICILIVLGLQVCLDWLESRKIRGVLLSSALFISLVLGNIMMLQDSLHDGPLWFQDYGLYGMQYGAQQLFGDAIPAYLERNPAIQFVVTPTWANGTDQFLQFFLTPEQRQQVRLDSIQAYLFERLPIDSNTIIVLTEPEFRLAAESPKFSNVQIKEVVKYPNGAPGFYFITFEYSAAADEIFKAEKIARSQPITQQITLGDQKATIRYSQIDMGQPENIFDEDPFTLIRGLEANPFVIELEFDQPRVIKQIEAIFANMDFSFNAWLYEELDAEPVVYETSRRGVQGDPSVSLIVDRGPGVTKKIRLEILSLNGGDRPHIHIRELGILP